MTDEEKKAIVELNHFSNMTAYWKQEEYTNSEIDNYIKIVLNLIEKQSKEIEDNKKYIVQLTDEQYRKLVDIIRDEISKEWEDKIEELEKENKKLNLIRLQYLVSSFPDTTETYKKYRKELDELLKEE